MMYSVECVYSKTRPGKSELNPAARGAFQVVFGAASLSKPKLRSNAKVVARKSHSTQDFANTAPLHRPLSCNRTILGIVNENVRKAFPGPEGVRMCTRARNALPAFLEEMDLEVFERFRNRTVFTVGTAKTTPLFSGFVVPMAFQVRSQYLSIPFLQLKFSICCTWPQANAVQHPFLLHTMITLTLLHEYHLSSPQGKQSRDRARLHHHWTLATHLFRNSFLQPLHLLTDSLRDALWGNSC